MEAIERIGGIRETIEVKQKMDKQMGYMDSYTSLVRIRVVSQIDFSALATGDADGVPRVPHDCPRAGVPGGRPGPVLVFDTLPRVLRDSGVGAMPPTAPKFFCACFPFIKPSMF